MRAAGLTLALLLGCRSATYALPPRPAAESLRAAPAPTVDAQPSMEAIRALETSCRQRLRAEIRIRARHRLR
jgi:hypothetical protein